MRPEKIAALDEGIMSIFGPGLKEFVDRNVRIRRLAFTTDLATAIAGAHVAFIAVSTPSRRGDGHADGQAIEARTAISSMPSSPSTFVNKLEPVSN